RIGICGTDLEIIQGSYGEAPSGSDYLILGHECLATVEEAPSNSAGIKKGDLVVPTVRRPDGCLNCQNGESDMCLTGHYKEHGIKGLHGFCSEYSVSDINFLVPVPAELSDVAVLLEPTSVAGKGVFQSFKIQERMIWKPQRALVLGTGPVGLLTVLLLRIRGLDVTAVATRPKDSLKARIVEKIGGTYVNANDQSITSLGKFDLILEETGVASLAAEAQGLLKRLLSISDRVRRPVRAMTVARSVLGKDSSLETPASPPIARAQKTGRPSPTALAPRARAMTISLPRLIPPSK